MSYPLDTERASAVVSLMFCLCSSSCVGFGGHCSSMLLANASDFSASVMTCLFLSNSGGIVITFSLRVFVSFHIGLRFCSCSIYSSFVCYFWILKFVSAVFTSLFSWFDILVSWGSKVLWAFFPNFSFFLLNFLRVAVCTVDFFCFFNDCCCL